MVASLLPKKLLPAEKRTVEMFSEPVRIPEPVRGQLSMFDSPTTRPSPPSTRKADPAPRGAASIFPVGARVLVDGKYQARVLQAFPEGSSSYLFPHYKLDIVGGDKNVAMAMKRVGVGPAPAPRGAASVSERGVGSKRPTFDVQRQRLLDGLRALGWAVVSGLKVPHASMGDSRLWFKTQAVYLNDLGTDPRNFAHTHSLVSDIRELKDATQLQEQVLRMRLIQRRNPR
jgi:hypothetical protein